MADTKITEMLEATSLASTDLLTVVVDPAGTPINKKIEFQNFGLATTAYVDAAVVGLYDHKGAYDASANSPDLDTSPSGVLKGDAYTVSVAGTFFAATVEAGDVLIADQDSPTLETHWTIVNKNIDSAAFAAASHTHSSTDVTDFAEAVDDQVNTLLVGGTDVTLTYDDGAGTLTIDSIGGGVTDHGAMTGLSNDDHTLYALADGTRWTTTQTADRAIMTDGSGNAVVSTVTATELGYLGSVTSAIQTQIDGKAASSHTHTAADIVSGTFADALVAESNVTQHEAALTVTESQISDLGTYLTTASIDTLAELNAIIGDATLIDTADSRLSDARTPTAHAHTASEVTDFAEAVDDRVGTLVVGGTDITATYDDGAGTLTIDSTASGGSSLPVVDTTGIAKGSSDATKIVRLEVDGLTTGTTRVLTVQDADGTIALTGHSHATTDVTSGTFADARVAESNVTQHEAALTVTESQISDLGTYSTTGHVHAASDITSGTLTHERGGIEADISAVAIGDVLAGTGTGTIGIVTSTGHSDGDVLTIQADGTLDFETPSGGGSSLPVVDTTGIAKGSSDATKIVRLEVDGLTTGTTRVLTVQDADGTIALTGHSTDHEYSGSDAINAEALGCTVTVSNYTASGPTLEDHLEGIDTALGSVGGTHATDHDYGGSDEVAAEALGCTVSVSNYTAAGPTLEDHLSGIDSALGSVGGAHASDHDYGGSDEIAAESLGCTVSVSNYTASGPSLSDHLEGIDTALGSVGGTHASDHTDGTDDIQSATASQKGLATAAQIAKLDGIETGATASTDGDGSTWTAQAATEANFWYGVTYGNGLFVAVSTNGTNRVMTSPDGINWTARSAAEANSWYRVTYGNGLFVAVSYDGTNRVMTSPDGINWTARSAAEANSWYEVTYSDGLFVAVSYNGTNRVMTSPDGINWTARSAAEANSWNGVTHGDGLFVSVSVDGTNRVMTSPDGVTWTARSAAEANLWRSVTYGNGLFVAVSSDGTNRVMTSPDGITWTARSATEANSWYFVTYGNGLFVAVSRDGTNRVMTSPDGITWTARSASEANSWECITYGNGLFVASAAGGTNRVMTSGKQNEILPLPVRRPTGITTITDAATITVDATASDKQRVTMAANRTLAFSNFAEGQAVQLRLTQDGTGSRTVTWPSSGVTINWSGGSAPTLTTTANKADWIVLICTDDTSGAEVYDGILAADNV